MLKSDDDATLVELRNGHSQLLSINTDDFCGEIFSDEHVDNEYQLIEINEKWDGNPANAPVSTESSP